MTGKSFQMYGAIPSAFLTDGGDLHVPLWAVTALSVDATYHLPPIGSSTGRASAVSHDDRISLSGLLVGPERYGWKEALERLAQARRRDGAGALTLTTSLTIRTDLFIQSLAMSVNANQRDVIDVRITLVHAPPPKDGDLQTQSKVGVGALQDTGGT